MITTSTCSCSISLCDVNNQDASHGSTPLLDKHNATAMCSATATHFASFICGDTTAWQSRCQNRRQTFVGQSFQDHRRNHDEDTRLQPLHEQKRPDFEQGVPVFHGGNDGRAHSRRGEGYRSGYVSLFGTMLQSIELQMILCIRRNMPWLMISHRFPCQHVRLGRYPCSSQGRGRSGRDTGRQECEWGVFREL